MFVLLPIRALRVATVGEPIGSGKQSASKGGNHQIA
jgi:hypothetical protein